MRSIDADVLEIEYEEQMKKLLSSTTHDNMSAEALSLLCGSVLIREAPTIEPDKKRWVATNVKKFPYLQAVDWITDDMKVVEILIINSKDDLPDYIEWETFDGGFTLRSNHKLLAPVQMRVLFEDNAAAARKENE